MNTLSLDLLEKYNISGPRYTSYPTAPEWKEDYDAGCFLAEIERTNQGDNTRPLSLYVHLPFCQKRCLFCGCNVVITQQTEQAEKYLGYLFQEIAQVARLINPQREVNQLHWGGGTPTYLSCEQMIRLFEFIKTHFKLASDAEIAIEVDPRVTTPEQIETLKVLGFNRISMGIQDFDPQVQKAIQRIQPLEMTEKMVNQCRELGFESLNMDLIYGLPFQTEATFSHTVDQVIRLSPDRIALYNYAHVPWLSPHQNKMPAEALPQGEQKFRIFRQALQTLLDAGYIYIGMDHFAKPDDELAVAQRQNTLHRNFMGYTTKAGSDLYGFGVSAISSLERAYAQNQKKLSTYYHAVEAAQLPTLRGYALSEEDVLRRSVIQQVLCHGQLHYAEYDSMLGDNGFQKHFDTSLSALDPLNEDGFVEMRTDGFTLTPLGRIFSRNAVMPFDAYLKQEATQAEQKPIFSKTL